MNLIPDRDQGTPVVVVNDYLLGHFRQGLRVDKVPDAVLAFGINSGRVCGGNLQERYNVYR